MKILLLGANGQVGQAIQQYALEHNIALIALSRQECDIANENDIKNTFKHHQPDVVINTAAYTAVDLAESESENAMLINGVAPAFLAKACVDMDALLIHLSTDYVFDGTSSDAYVETDLTNPLNIYGVSKLSGELAILEVAKRFIILRVSWVFGLAGQNFVKTILKLANEKEELKVVADQYGCPTSAASIAEVIFKLARLNISPAQSGIYHYCNESATTWFDFAQSIVSEAKKTKSLLVRNIIPIVTAQMPRPAKRPMNSVLCCNKIENTFGIKPAAWHEELMKILNDI